MGDSDAFEDAIADFAIAYADQTERDHQALLAAVRAGRVEAETGFDLSAESYPLINHRKLTNL